MPNPQTNLRLDTAIRERAIATAKAQGITLATLVERALTAYLDGGVAGDSAVVSDSRPDTTVLSEQIADLIARVEKLEAPPPPSATVATEGTSTGQSSARAARADGAGQRGLTARQAWEYCLSQGWVSPRGSTTQSAFVQWAGRNPDKLLLQYGLAPTGHSGSSNTTASYRKV